MTHIDVPCLLSVQLAVLKSRHQGKKIKLRQKKNPLRTVAVLSALSALWQRPRWNFSGEKVNSPNFCKQCSHLLSPFSSSFFLSGILSSEVRLSFLIFILAHDAAGWWGRPQGLPTVWHHTPTRKKRQQISSEKKVFVSTPAESQDLAQIHINIQKL